MNKKGFTLIELLVVISIIGVLSAVVLASLNTARAKARDASRLTLLKETQKALELYYDIHGRYPAWSTATWGRDCSGFRGTTTTNNTMLAPLVTGGFLAGYPQDPVAGECRIQYRDEASGQGYRLLMNMERLPVPANNCYPDTYWYCVSVNY